MTGRGLPPLAPRWVLRTYGMLCAMAGLVTLLLAVMQVLVIATDGAFMDEPSATAEDWIFLALAVATTVLNAVIAAGSFLHARAAE